MGLEIIDRRCSSFGELERGEFFEFEYELYMKLGGIPGDPSANHAVHLQTGEVYTICSTESVKRLNGKLILED